MFIEQAIPLLVGIIVGLLVSVIAWNVMQAHQQTTGDMTLSQREHVVLYWLLLVAVFVAGVFLTYLLLRF